MVMNRLQLSLEQSRWTCWQWDGYWLINTPSVLNIRKKNSFKYKKFQSTLSSFNAIISKMPLI